MRGTKIAVVAILAGVVLTPRLMPGHPIVETVERFMDRAFDRVSETVMHTVAEASDSDSQRRSSTPPTPSNGRARSPTGRSSRCAASTEPSTPFRPTVIGS